MQAAAGVPVAWRVCLGSSNFAAAFEERLRAAGRELTERAEAWRDRSRRACPDGDDLIRLGPPPAWTRAGPRLDLTVRLGARHDRAPVPVRLDDATGTAADDDRVERAVRTALEGPLDVTVDDKTFAHATAGAQGQRLAALIVGTTKENR